MVVWLHTDYTKSTLSIYLFTLNTQEAVIAAAAVQQRQRGIYQSTYSTPL